MPDTDGRYPVTEEERVRVGDPRSPVLPGDINPNNALPYRAGQFAPSVDELTQDALMEASEAGVLPSNLPIYDEFGSVDPDMLDSWNPRTSLYGMGVGVVPDVPKYASAMIAAALANVGVLPRRLGLTEIRSAGREDAAPVNKGNIIIAARYSGKGPNFRGALEVYPEFFRFISVPVAPRVSGRASGVSVASYATYHAMGHLLFARLAADGQLSEMSSVLGNTWTKDKTASGTMWGNFLGERTTLTWRMPISKRMVSELAKNSPSDDFAETFALRFSNPEYLYRVFPEKYEAMTALLEKYAL